MTLSSPPFIAAVALALSVTPLAFGGVTVVATVKPSPKSLVENRFACPVMLSNVDETLAVVPSAFCSVPLIARCGSPADDSETFAKLAAAPVDGVAGELPNSVLPSFAMYACTAFASWARMPVMPRAGGGAPVPFGVPNQAGRTPSPALGA